MANLFYPTAKKKLLDGDIDLLVDTIKCVLLKTAYSIESTDEFLAAVGGSNRVGTAQTLGSKSTTAGVFDAANATFPAVPTDDECDKVLIYKDTGNEATSALICSLDLSTAIDPDGGNIEIRWSDGAGKIFRLN